MSPTGSGLPRCVLSVRTWPDRVGARLPRERRLDGRSFLPQLRGQQGNPRDWVFCHYFRDAGDPVQCFVRDKRWKLYANGNLFDIDADPLEERPIARDDGDATAAAARQRLQAVLDSLL